MRSPFAATMLDSLPASRTKPLTELFPAASPDAIDLIRQCLHFNPDRRISAFDALRHPYVGQFHNEADEQPCPHILRIQIDDNTKYVPAAVCWLRWCAQSAALHGHAFVIRPYTSPSPFRNTTPSARADTVPPTTATVSTARSHGARRTRRSRGRVRAAAVWAMMGVPAMKRRPRWSESTRNRRVSQGVGAWRMASTAAT